MRLGIVVVAMLLMAGCTGCQSDSQVEEDREAKDLMQGVWVDAETEDLTFRVSGDTIFYADSTSMPAYFKVVGDILVLRVHLKAAFDAQSVAACSVFLADHTIHISSTHLSPQTVPASPA